MSSFDHLLLAYGQRIQWSTICRRPWNQCAQPCSSSDYYPSTSPRWCWPSVASTCDSPTQCPRCTLWLRFGAEKPEENWFLVGSRYCGSTVSARGHELRLKPGPCPLLAQSGHLFHTANVRFWGQSGHDVLHCKCLLLTQSGHSRPRSVVMSAFDIGTVRVGDRCAILQSGLFRKEVTWPTNRITVCNALIATVQHKHGASKNSERERKNLLNAKPNVQ